MVSTTEVFTENSPISPSQSTTVKNPIARKPIHKFLDTLEVKPKSDIRRFRADKSKRKEIRAGSMLWSSIPKRHSHTKVNQQVKSKRKEIRSGSIFWSSIPKRHIHTKTNK